MTDRKFLIWGEGQTLFINIIISIVPFLFQTWCYYLLDFPQTQFFFCTILFRQSFSSFFHGICVIYRLVFFFTTLYITYHVCMLYQSVIPVMTTVYWSSMNRNTHKHHSINHWTMIRNTLCRWTSKAHVMAHVHI